MRWMKDRIGERSSGAYAFRSLMEGGALLVFGSDWPGTNASWYPAERITMEEALEADTVNAAWAEFAED
jgi:predicted amidohydrolase YtcJ